jgi:hypothetical protein
MSELGTESLEASLGAAFGDAPVAPPAPIKASRPPEPDEQEEPAQEGAEVVDPADLESEIQEPKAEVEPEFEIEIEAGKPETLPLSRLKELAARGAKAGRGFEENARVREALQAHVQQVQFQQQFQQAVSQDIAQVQALDMQLQQFEKLDWSAAYDNDFIQAAKWKEQRDQLREQRAAAVNNLNAKQQQFQDFSKQNVQKALAAENEALLAKVPAWRNAEKAKQEQGEIAGVLKDHYGFTAQEVGSLIDHRHLLVARDAAAYRKLLANKDAKVKQAREAPATAKPGATTTQNGRADFAKAKGLLKAHGAKGNHKAQEDIAAAMFAKAFK